MKDAHFSSSRTLTYTPLGPVSAKDISNSFIAGLVGRCFKVKAVHPKCGFTLVLERPTAREDISCVDAGIFVSAT